MQALRPTFNKLSNQNHAITEDTQEINFSLCEETEDQIMRRNLNSGVFALCFGEVADEEIKIIKFAAAATVIMPSSNQNQSPIMDCLVVGDEFRERGTTRALQNCAMIMSVFRGNHHPRLFLVTEKVELSYRIYTKHLGFKEKQWKDLHAHVTVYAESVNYINSESDPQVTPLCRTGLLVKATNVLDKKQRGCPNSTILMVQQLEELCLDNGFFFRLLQDEGQTSTRSSTVPTARCVHYKGFAYKIVWLAAKQLCVLTRIASDTLNGLFPRRPEDPGECASKCAHSLKAGW